MTKIQVTFISLLSSSYFLAAKEIRVPDDHETIQDAIAEANTGDVILVIPGTYRERIVLKAGIQLRSVGPEGKGEIGLTRAETTIIDGGNEVGDSPGVTMAEGSTLDGFTITNVGRYDDEKWQKHWDEKGQNQMHAHIGKFGTPGIAITGATSTVINNIVHHNGDTGIAIRGAEGKLCTPVISGNICYRNMGGGIGSMMGSSAIIDRNICFQNFYAGIGHNGADSVVTRNECYENIRAGIGISEGASPTVRKNRCHGNRRAGIGIRTGASTCPVIEDNDCYENEMAGIGSEEEAAPVIRGNRCYRNKLAGIGCRDHSSPLIVENHCYENKAAGIGIDSADALLFRNRVERNEAAGIGINNGSKASVIENTCAENRLVAVGIPNGGEVLLQKNTFVRTGGMPPIIAIFGDSKVVLTGNLIKGGGVAGVMSTGRLYAIGNTIEGKNGASGILVRKDSEATLSGNRISGYRMAVRDQGAKSIVNSEQSRGKKTAK